MKLFLIAGVSFGLLVMCGVFVAVGSSDRTAGTDRVAPRAAALNPIERAIDAEASRQMAKIENQVAVDSVQQYEMVKRSGDKLQTCVHAGMVEAAYVQAKDEPGFQKWHGIKKADCAAAGMPE